MILIWKEKWFNFFWTSKQINKHDLYLLDNLILQYFTIIKIFIPSIFSYPLLSVFHRHLSTP
jgi:hypothetical protein